MAFNLLKPRTWFGTSRSIAQDAAPVPGDAPVKLTVADAERFAGAINEWKRGVRGFDGLVSIAAGLGTTLDKTETAFYAAVPPLSQMYLTNAYVGSWLPRRIIDCIAEDLTREWVNLSWTGHDTDGDGQRLIEAEESKTLINARGAMADGIRWGGLFGGACVVAFIKGQKLDQPLDLNSIRQGDLEALHVADRWFCPNAGSFIRTPDPTIGYPIGYPEYYELVEMAGAIGSGSRVHASRVIRFPGAPVPILRWMENARWDDSVLQAPFNTIKRYDAMYGGIGSLIWDAKNDVMMIEDLKQLIADGQEDELRRRFNAVAMMKSLYNFTLLDKNDAYEQKQLHFGGLPNLITEFRYDVAGSCDIPMTRLFGQSPAGMNSTGESDLTNYYDHLSGLQEARYRQCFWRLYQWIVRSALGKEPAGLALTFNPLWQMSETEHADVGLKRAQRDEINWRSGWVSGGVISKNIRRDRTYPDMRDEDVAMVEQLEGTPQQQALPAGGGGGEGEGGTDTPFGAADSVYAIDRVKKIGSKWYVFTENGQKRLSRGYGSRAEALGRLGEIEYFKHQHDVKAADSTQVQSFAFDPKQFTEARAVAWLKRNKRPVGEQDIDPDAIRYRQEDPTEFIPGTFRTIQIAPGVTAVIGHPRLKNDGTDIASRRAFQGFNLAIENPAGSTRKWYDAAGNVRGLTAMKHDYGFFQDHLGEDGEELDCYVGPHEDAKQVYVVHQMKRPDYVKPDESKVMLGFRSPDEALEAFCAHRDDGDRAIGGMSMLPVDNFRRKLLDRTGIGKIRA